jgi:RNA polymerase sigma-70 factor (ECF subfamily)
MSHLTGMEGMPLPIRTHSRPKVQVAGDTDRDGFTELVRRHHGDVVRVCKVILGDANLAEDAAQATWIKAWRKLHQLRDRNKVRQWLMAVAANEARQFARRRRPEWSLTVESPAAGPDPRSADLAAALARLSPEERRLLALRYVGQLTSEEIGTAVGTSAAAVRHRLMRLLGRLRSELGE